MPIAKNALLEPPADLACQFITWMPTIFSQKKCQFGYHAIITKISIPEISTIILQNAFAKQIFESGKNLPPK
jgi:hypothetical protein